MSNINVDYGAIKKESERLATELGYRVNPSLPALVGEGLQKSLSEVRDRALSLFAVVAVAHGWNSSDAKNWLERNDLVSKLSRKEREFIHRPSSADKSSFMVQGESLWALAWVLRKVDHLDFGERCSDDLVKLFPDPLQGEMAGTWGLEDGLRSNGEIVAGCDLGYRLHWAIFDAYLNRRPMPGRVPEYVVVERRRALEWLIQDQPWDDVSLDT